LSSINSDVFSALIHFSDGCWPQDLSDLEMSFGSMLRNVSISKSGAKMVRHAARV